ncbi:MAG: TetR/AcrR family transcriptional regulator [Coriobacteriales bacterium]|nr:TetR/AcrR family transcriptional regulator [Coriobacteriales bacterium]
MTDSELFADEEGGRRGEILDAALGVFAERGYDAGSMREIAGRVGVSEPALYRHFPGKEAIFLTLMDAVAGRVSREAFALLEQAHAETLREQIIAAFADRREAMTRYAVLLRTVVTAAAHHHAFLVRYRERVVLPMKEALTVNAARLDDEFGLTDGDIDRDARVRALMGLFVGSMISSFVLGDQPDEAVADAALRVMRWG